METVKMAKGSILYKARNKRRMRNRIQQRTKQHVRNAKRAVREGKQEVLTCTEE